MFYFLFIVLFVAFLLNLNAPEDLTDVTAGALSLEFVGTLFVAFFLINRMVPDKEDRERIVNCFLLGYSISLLLLFFYWTPLELGISGFDPVRYYDYAATLKRGDIIIDGLNYWGVVIFYFVLFWLFGVDPLIPLFFNVLLVLYVYLLLARFLIRVDVPYKASAYLLLIPEVLLYNVMSSREILCMAFGIIILLNFYFIYHNEAPKKRIISVFFILLLMIIIRPPYGIGATIVMAIYSMLNITNKKKLFLLSGVMIVIILFGLMIATNIGGGDDVGASLTSTVEARVTGENSESDNFEYSQNSIAAKLIPNNPVQFVIYGIIRSMAYLVVPPSSILSPIESFDFITSNSGYIEWTTLFMMILIPCIYKTVRREWRSSSEVRFLTVAFLTYFLMVGVFNTNLIQQRYRIIYDLFYFALGIIYLSKRNKHENPTESTQDV